MNIRAVFLLSLFLLLAACTAAPPDVAPPTPAVAPSATALPASPTPAPTPEPTATLTAAQLRDQRATAVLLTLPGYDPAQHDALLPLARALWGDEDVIDPADVAIVVGETAVACS